MKDSIHIADSNKLVFSYDSRLVCPVTHRPLEHVKRGQIEVLSEPVSDREYKRRNGVFCMIPEQMSESLVIKIPLWKQLQANGALSYRLAPELNLTMEPGYTRQFAEAMGLSGRVLDIGCGPQRERPKYVSQIPVDDYVGLDPICGEQPRLFFFVHGIGEALPFPDENFDHVIFSSSLDHMIDYKMAIREAFRVVKRGGQINILMDIVDETARANNGLVRIIHIVFRGIKQFSSAKKSLGFKAALAYVYRIATLPLPVGAMDYFHSYFPRAQDIFDCIDDQGSYDFNQTSVDSEILLLIHKKY